MVICLTGGSNFIAYVFGTIHVPVEVAERGGTALLLLLWYLPGTSRLPD
jgi:hypothetical protein